MASQSRSCVGSQPIIALRKVSRAQPPPLDTFPSRVNCHTFDPKFISRRFFTALTPGEMLVLGLFPAERGIEGGQKIPSIQWELGFTPSQVTWRRVAWSWRACQFRPTVGGKSERSTLMSDGNDIA